MNDSLTKALAIVKSAEGPMVIDTAEFPKVSGPATVSWWIDSGGGERAEVRVPWLRETATKSVPWFAYFDLRLTAGRDNDKPSALGWVMIEFMAQEGTRRSGQTSAEFRWATKCSDQIREEIDRRLRECPELWVALLVIKHHGAITRHQAKIDELTEALDAVKERQASDLAALNALAAKLP